MLSRRPVRGLGVLGMCTITNTAAFLTQPYCHLLSWEGTACLFALHVSSSVHCVLHHLCVCYSYIICEF